MPITPIRRLTPGEYEWERDTDLGYVIQSGPLKNINVLWRNAALR